MCKLATIDITVNALPVVTFGALADVCVDAADFALAGGSPVGGTYSGTGVAAGNFSPATAGTGTHTITYTYTDGNGCVNSATAILPSTHFRLLLSAPLQMFVWMLLTLPWQVDHR